MRKSAVMFFAIIMLLAFSVGTVAAETSDSVEASTEAPLDKLINSLVGTPYRWGGTTENGFDCSGFTRFVYSKLGIELNRTSSSQSTEGSWVSKSDLRPGDLVFFNTSGRGISHVGIYIGDGNFAHSGSNSGVIITALDSTYYKNRYVTARRILSDELFTEVTSIPELDSEEAAVSEEPVSE